MRASREDHSVDPIEIPRARRKIAANPADRWGDPNERLQAGDRAKTGATQGHLAGQTERLAEAKMAARWDGRTGRTVIWAGATQAQFHPLVALGAGQAGTAVAWSTADRVAPPGVVPSRAAPIA